jgi:hypothetical protein
MTNDTLQEARFAEVYVRVGPVEARSIMTRETFESDRDARGRLRALADTAVTAVVDEVDANPERFRRWLERVTARPEASA